MQFFDLIGETVIGFAIEKCPLCNRDVATQVSKIPRELYDTGVLAERISRKRHPKYTLTTDPISGEKVCEKCLLDNG
jgi:hypothetical protein